MCRLAVEDQIIIVGLEFYAYHGASDQEQTVGHRYVVDLTLSCDLNDAAESDRLSDTVSYSRVARRVQEIATAEQYRLLEALAGRLCETVLAEFDRVSKVDLKLVKTCPPMNAIVQSVGVRMVRTRC